MSSQHHRLAYRTNVLPTPQTSIQNQCPPNTTAVQITDLVQWSWSVSPGEVPHIGAGETAAQTHTCHMLPSVPTAARCHSCSNEQQICHVGWVAAYYTNERSYLSSLNCTHICSVGMGRKPACGDETYWSILEYAGVYWDYTGICSSIQSLTLLTNS